MAGARSSAAVRVVLFDGRGAEAGGRMTDADTRRCAYLVVGRYLEFLGRGKTLRALINEIADYEPARGAILREVERIRDAMLAAGAVRDG